MHLNQKGLLLYFIYIYILTILTFISNYVTESLPYSSSSNALICLMVQSKQLWWKPEALSELNRTPWFWTYSYKPKQRMYLEVVTHIWMWKRTLSNRWQALCQCEVELNYPLKKADISSQAVEDYESESDQSWNGLTAIKVWFEHLET